MLRKTSLTLKAEHRRTIDRVWSKHLSGSEQKVVGFIFTTTLEWGKPSDRLRLEHFTDGLGKALGTGLCARTVRRALDRLEAAGALSRVRTPRGYRIALNMDWEPMLATPKKDKASPKTNGLAVPKQAQVTGQNVHSRMDKMSTPIEERDIPRKGTYPSASAAPRTRIATEETSEGLRESPMAVRAAIDAVNAAEVARKAAARKAGKLDMGSMSRLWVECFREAFPGVLAPAWGAREQGQARNFLRSPHGRHGAPLDVFEFAVRSWTTIMAARFSWMEADKPPPEHPTIGFMLRFKDRFYEAWNERERLRSEIVMTGAERQTKRLMARGLTEEEAKAEVQGRASIAEERERLAQQREELNEKMRRVDARAAAPIQPYRLATPRTKANPVQPKGDFE